MSNAASQFWWRHSVLFCLCRAAIDTSQHSNDTARICSLSVRQMFWGSPTHSDKLFDLLHFNKVHLLVIYSCSYAANSDINLLYKPKYSRQAHGSVTVIRLTFPPWAPRTAKQNRVDGDALPGMENCENAAAWPSIGWLTLRSTE